MTTAAEAEGSKINEALTKRVEKLEAEIASITGALESLRRLNEVLATSCEQMNQFIESWIKRGGRLPGKKG